MPETNARFHLPKKLRTALRWITWVLLAQFVLMNISAIFYASRLTYIKNSAPPLAGSGGNIIHRTVKLFTGPRLYRLPEQESPVFPFDTVQLQTSGGITIQAWYGKQDTAARGTVILFHGVTSNKATMLVEANEFRYWGYNVLLVDFRAHGNSGGNITTYGIKEAEDVKLAFDYISSTGEKNIILWGISMGAVTVAKAVADYGLQPKGVILEAPFASMEKHFKGRARTLGFPAQPFGWLVTKWAGIIRGVKAGQHKTTRYVSKITCPALVQWGRLDTYVLQQEAEDVYNAIPAAEKKLVVYENTGHASMAQQETDKWRAEVSQFLQKTAR